MGRRGQSKKGSKQAGPRPAPGKRVTLRDLAEYLNLSVATVSRALSGSPQADALAADTRARVVRAAEKLNYRPNYLAQSLRGKRTYSVGVLVPEISEGYAAGVMSGIEGCLNREGYFYLMVSHRSRPEVLKKSFERLRDRGVEGFIVIAAEPEVSPGAPAVVVSGHRPVEGLTNVVVNHDAAARLALTHLKTLGHEDIAFFRGRPGNIDSADRWRAIREAAVDLSLSIRPELALQLRGETYGDTFSPDGGYQEGYAYGERLLRTGKDFSALFAFNDISALGAMRAFQDQGLQVPGDVSVIGFDDIGSAPFHRPSLTTIRQPLRRMGEIAAQTLVHKLNGEPVEPVIVVEPELKVRQSTGRL